MSTPAYTIGDELGDLGVFWRDTYGNLIDFSSGYTFSLKVYDSTGTAWFTKTTGMTGAAGSDTTDPKTPNLTVAWATSAELTTITTTGTYPLRITATRSADSKTRTFRGSITILPAA